TDPTANCVVSLSMASRNNHFPSTSANFTVTLNKSAQATLTVTAPSSVTFGSTGQILTSGGSGTGALSYSHGSSTGCTANSSTGEIGRASCRDNWDVPAATAAVNK